MQNPNIEGNKVKIDKKSNGGIHFRCRERERERSRETKSNKRNIPTLKIINMGTFGGQVFFLSFFPSFLPSFFLSFVGGLWLEKNNTFGEPQCIYGALFF